MVIFKPLAKFEPTRKTLHLYSKAVGEVVRADGIFHPKWWHISLTVTPRGLTTDSIPIPDGGILGITIDFRDHLILFEASDRNNSSLQMDEGLTGAEMGEKVLETAASFGLTGDGDRSRFDDQTERIYDPEQAELFFETLLEVDRIFRIYRAGLAGYSSPVQFWTHGFDLSLEWYSDKLVPYQENGETKCLPAQINLGFYPGGEEVEPYFYSNPWPFDQDHLVDFSLPEGALWHTEDWNGSILPYQQLVGKPDAKKQLLDYARSVFQAAKPTLTDRS